MLPVQCMKIEDWQVQENRGNRNGYNNWCFYKQLRWREEMRAEMSDQHIERHSGSEKGLIFVTKNASS